MLQPPEWRVEASDEFEQEFAALTEKGSRLDEFRRSWYFYLERRPVEYSEGLTRADDDVRVFVNVDPHDGIEYVVGLTVERGRGAVRLRWVDSRELS